MCQYPILFILPALVPPVNSLFQATEFVDSLLDKAPAMLNGYLASVRPFRLMLVEVIMYPFVVTTTALVYS